MRERPALAHIAAPATVTQEDAHQVAFLVWLVMVDIFGSPVRNAEVIHVLDLT